MVLEHNQFLSISNVTLIRLVQPANAALPMLVTLPGMVMLARLVQL